MGLAAQKQGGEKESEDTVVFRLRVEMLSTLHPISSQLQALNP